MVFRTTVFILTLIGCCFSANAEPENVLVGNLHFTRPLKWIWEAPPENSSAVTRFVIPDGAGDTSSTSVRFYETSSSVDSALKTWSKWFPQDKPQERFQQQVINGRELVCHRFDGTYVFARNAPKRNFTMIGAVIPWERKYIHVLLLGPWANVQDAHADFRNMIETALAASE